jgi:Uma2 family endonuclease
MQSSTSKLTFEAYLAHTDDVDRQYELVDGELVEMPPEDRINSKIALALLSRLLEVFPEEQLCYKDTEIEVSGTLAKVRLPDLMLLSAELASILGDGRGTITRDMPPPDLIIEVVSPGKTNAERDYRYKRSEYGARGVSEYWVINPSDRHITGFSLEAGFYESATYTGQMVIRSRFDLLQLTAEQVLNRGR